MNEYISKEKAIELIQPRVKPSTVYGEGYLQAIEHTSDMIALMPAADVQPVIHAYWIELPKALNSNENPCKCSNCDHILSFMNYYPKSKYCPNCGARMDGDKE